jgi:septation ring formation regulator EzrA
MFIVIVAATSLMILFMIYYIFQKRNNKYQTIEKLIERGDRVIKDPSSECVASIETDGTNESNSNHDGNVI